MNRAPEFIKNRNTAQRGKNDQHSTDAGIVQVSDTAMQGTLKSRSSKMRRQIRLGHLSDQGSPMPTIVPYTDLLNTYPWVAITTLLTCHVHGLVYTRGVCTEKYDPGSFQDHM